MKHYNMMYVLLIKCYWALNNLYTLNIDTGNF